MGRPYLPLTEEQKHLISRLIEYDTSKGVLVWKPRRPEDFKTWEPERTAAGFNRKFVGRPVATDPESRVQFTIRKQRYSINQNKILAFLGAPHKPIDQYAEGKKFGIKPIDRVVRHPHARGAAARKTSPEGNTFDASLIRLLMRKDERGDLRWNRLAGVELAKRLDEASLRVGPHRAMINALTLKYWSARQGDQLVRVTTAGVVRAFGVFKIGVPVLRSVFGVADVAVTEVSTEKRVPLPDGVVRKLFRFDHRGVVWRPRDKALWVHLVLIGAYPKMPSDERILLWNDNYAGALVGSAWSKRTPNLWVKVGKKTVTISRVRRLCEV